MKKSDTYNNLLLEIKLILIQVICFILTFRLLNVLLSIIHNVLSGDLLGYPDDEGSISSEDEAGGETNEGEEAKMDAFLDEMLADSAFEREREQYYEQRRYEDSAGVAELMDKNASAKHSRASNHLFDKYNANQHSLLFDLHYPLDNLPFVNEEELQPAPDYKEI